MATFTGLTLGEMRAEVLSLLSEPSSGYYTREDVNRWINLASLDFVRRTNVLRSAVVSVSVAGQKQYGLPDDFMTFEKVFYDGDELEYKNEHQILHYAGGVDDLDTTGRSEVYYVLGTSDSTLCMYLYPVPESTGLDINIWYVQRPDKLEDDTDTSIIIGTWHEAITWKAVASGCMKRRQMAEAKYYLDLYGEAVLAAKSWREAPHIDHPQSVTDEGTWSGKGLGNESAITES